MAALVAHQRCWNHETREAVCRCMVCARSYCRECVAEHEGRLLCAACMGAAAALGTVRRGRLRRAAPAAMLAAGILLAWLAYWTLGESLIAIMRGIRRGSPAESSWRNGVGGFAAPNRVAALAQPGNQPAPEASPLPAIEARPTEARQALAGEPVSARALGAFAERISPSA